MAVFINEELAKIEGYYCGYCNKFYAPDEIKKTYTVEVIGKQITIKDEEISCTECGYHSDLEKFDPKAWTNLAALIQARYNGKAWIKVPIYDSENDIFPKSHKTVRTVEEVEEIADWYCIEVVKATIDEFDLMDVEVEFQ